MASNGANVPVANFSNYLSIVAALMTCIAGFLGSTPYQVGAVFMDGPSATGSGPGMHSDSALDTQLYQNFQSSAARLAEPSPLSPPSNDILNQEMMSQPSLMTSWQRDSAMPNPLIADPEPFSVEARSTRLRFGKRTPPAGFTVRGTRLRFGKRADEANGLLGMSDYLDMGIAPNHNRIHTRGTRLRFGKRNSQRLRFGKRANEIEEAPEFYDHPVGEIPEEEYTALIESLSAPGNTDLDSDQSRLMELLSNNGFEKKSPSSRLRFGKKSAGIPNLGSEGSDKNVRLRFGKRSDDDDTLYYGQPRMDVFKRPASRLRFGKRSVVEEEVGSKVPSDLQKADMN